MFPLGFGEFLDFHGVSYRRRNNFNEMRFDLYEFERLKGFYEEFVTFGGLPDVALEHRPEIKREILLDIFSSYINIDVRAMADFKKNRRITAAIANFSSTSGYKLDYTKLSQVIGITRPTLMTYPGIFRKNFRGISIARIRRG